MYRRLDGLQGRCGLVRKISPQTRFDPWTVQPVASRYTDWAIPTHIKIIWGGGEYIYVYNVAKCSFSECYCTWYVKLPLGNKTVSSQIHKMCQVTAVTTECGEGNFDQDLTKAGKIAGTRNLTFLPRLVPGLRMRGVSLFIVISFLACCLTSPGTTLLYILQRFSAPVHTGPEAHSASYKTDTGSLSRR
jgi:hypothetical protein